MKTFNQSVRYSSKILRFVTATSLFDGHDASINILRRILQSAGAEVVHLGHNRSVREIVDAAVEEDVDAIAEATGRPEDVVCMHFSSPANVMKLLEVTNPINNKSFFLKKRATRLVEPPVGKPKKVMKM